MNQISHLSFSLCLFSLMLEWDDLLDGHLAAGDRVGGGGHHAVRPLPEELQVVVPRSDLKERFSFILGQLSIGGMVGFWYYAAETWHDQCYVFILCCNGTKCITQDHS